MTQTCKLIQWTREKPPVDADGCLVCPKCGEPAELSVDFVGLPCYAHKREAAKEE